MATRLCGYCRQEGHRMPDCDVKRGHINEIVTNVKGERKFLISHMERVGLGVGATIKVPPYPNDTPLTYVLTHADWISNVTSIQQRKVKYSKQVRLNPRHLLERDANNRIFEDQYGYAQVEALCLERNEMRSFNLWMVGIAKSVMVNDVGDIPDYPGKNVYIISPSHEPYNLTEADYGKHIPIHKRLVDKAEADKASRWDKLVWKDF